MSSETAQVAYSGNQPCLTVHPERSEEEFGFVKELMLEKIKVVSFQSLLFVMYNYGGHIPILGLLYAGYQTLQELIWKRYYYNSQLIDEKLRAVEVECFHRAMKAMSILLQNS